MHLVLLKKYDFLSSYKINSNEALKLPVSAFFFWQINLKALRTFVIMYTAKSKCWFFNELHCSKLAVDAWFPYDWKKSPAFEISHIYLCFTHILLGFCFCLSDTFLFSIMYTTIGQFRILGRLSLQQEIQLL